MPGPLATRVGISVLVLTGSLGGGRLVHDEAALRRHEGEAASYARRLAVLQADASRAGALELELAQARVLAASASRHEAAAASLRRDLHRAQALASARARTRARLAGRAGLRERAAAWALASAARRGADLARTSSELASRTTELASRTSDLAARDLEVSRQAAALRDAATRLDAETAARASAERLATERGQALTAATDEAHRLSRRAASLADLAEALGHAGQDVLRLAASAAQAAEERRAVLARLQENGVDVELRSRPLPPVSGKVRRVREGPPALLVTLDAGTTVGLVRGDPLYVVRDGRVVARLTVHEVEGADAIVAVAAWTDRGVRIDVMDRVTTRPPGR